jgi:hypothetical protein
MKTKVSKKAIGIFVASQAAVVLLLVVFMMSEPTRVAMATRASQCKVRPENASIATGPDVLFPLFPQPVFGGREDVTPPRPPVPSTPNHPNPPIVIGGGGGSPWDVGGGRMPWDHLFTPNLPISTPSPIAGQWSPLATPPYKPPTGGRLPDVIACELGHEGESILSANTTVDLDAIPEEMAMNAQLAKRRYDEQKKYLYNAWHSHRDYATSLRAQVYVLNDDHEQAEQLVREFFAERERVDKIFEATDGNFDPADYNKLIFHLNNFSWLPTSDADELGKVKIDMGVGNVIVYVAGPSSRRDRFPDEGDMI